MRHLGIISLILVAALVFQCQPAIGDDLADLKAADAKGERLFVSLDPNDIEAYVNMFDEDFIYIAPDLAFPLVVTREEIRQTKTAEVAQTEYANWIPGNAIYRVIGTTGIVCKFGTSITKPKGSPEVVNNLRFIITLVKTGGEWLICATHVSRIPLAN